jgi:hypothetical protein
MKAVGKLVIIIPLIIAGATAVLCFANVPFMWVAGESIGFGDALNFIFGQAPPNLPEADPSNNTEIAAWFTQVNGSEAGEAMGMLQTLGNPLKFCVFKDANYCEIFRIEGGRIYTTSESPQKTLYVSYELAMELKQRAETKNYEGLDKRLVQAVKSGDIKGMTLNDVMNLEK